MQDFARKLMSLNGGETTSALPTAIFGSVDDMSQNLDTRERFRIAMWPIVSETKPEIALGTSVILSHLMEQWQDVRVYRLFIQLDGEPDTFDWAIEKSQFGLDDWQLDNLDDNVAMWGTLSYEDEKYTLTLEIESDLDEEEAESTRHVYETPDLASLINVLPSAAQDIAAVIGSDPPLITPYKSTALDTNALASLFDLMVQWHVKLQLSLWGKPWTEREALDSLKELVQATSKLDDEFSAWCAGVAAAYAMLPGFDTIAENVAVVAPDIPEQFIHSTYPTTFIARALYNSGGADQAYDLLEDEIERNPNSASAWITLGELYRSGGRYLDGLDAFQRGIEAEATSQMLYLRYIDLIFALNFNQLTFDEFVLVEPDDHPDASDSALMGWEVVEAYEELLKFDPADTQLHYRQIRQLVAIDETAKLWEKVERFIALKPDGELVRALVDELDHIEEIDEPLIDLLKKATQGKDAPIGFLLALASLYIARGEEDAALDLLERAEGQTKDPNLLAEIDRLFLTADDPEFETRIGDIRALVDAGSKLSNRDMDFLEDSLERAPDLIDLYLLAGKGYQVWEDDDAALETLLDGHERAPDDPEVLAALGELLWEMDQKDLAFDYLNKGITAHPNHITLLALTGQYLFEDGQDDKARLYLARAEMIAPRHPDLAEARRVVAQMLSQRKE